MQPLKNLIFCWHYSLEIMGMNTVNFSWVFHAISRYYFFAVNHFKSLYWIWYNIFSVLCFGFFWSWRLWHLSSLTRDQTYTLCTGRQSRNHWTTREDPAMPFFDSNTPIGSPFPALLFPMLACRHYYGFLNQSKNNFFPFNYFSLGIKKSWY